VGGTDGQRIDRLCRGQQATQPGLAMQCADDLVLERLRIGKVDLRGQLDYTSTK
jgi:hypothetical protein